MWPVWTSCRRLRAEGKPAGVADDGQRTTQQNPAGSITAVTTELQSCPRVSVAIQGQAVSCLVDTGSPVSIFPHTMLRTGTKVGHSSEYHFLRTADGKHLDVIGETTEDIEFKSGNDQHTFSHKFIIADVITGPILGADFLSKQC